MNRYFLSERKEKLKEAIIYIKERWLGQKKESAETVEAKMLDEEIRNYRKDHPQEPQDKVLRESGGQDISAI